MNKKNPSVFILSFLLLLITLLFAVFAYLFINQRHTLSLIQEITKAQTKINEDQNKRIDDLETITNLLLSKGQIELKPTAETSSSTDAIFPLKIAFSDSHKDDPFIGDKNAPVVVMAFTNYQCEQCRKFVKETLPLLKKEYFTTGKAKFILRDVPITTTPNATMAAEVANCAGEQGAYWTMHDMLFANESAVDKGQFENIIEKLVNNKNIKTNQITSCFKKHKYTNEVKGDFEDALRFGAKGVPSFFIGKKNADGEFEGVFIRGAQPLDVIAHQIDTIADKNSSQKARNIVWQK